MWSKNLSSPKSCQVADTLGNLSDTCEMLHAECAVRGSVAIVRSCLTKVEGPRRGFQVGNKQTAQSSTSAAALARKALAASTHA